MGRTGPHRRIAQGAGHSPTTELPESLDGFCLFLDVDGTLLDLADTPDAVIVPHGLYSDLRGLCASVEGALALVTGRPIAVVDRLFPGNDFFVAGLHGAELRVQGAGVPDVVPCDGLDAAKARIEQVTRGWAGVLVEDKGGAVAVHYRLAPAMEPLVRSLMETIAGMLPDWTLQAGKFVLELRPAGRDKGDALKTFLERPPFLGRLPLAVGDDVTDEAMFKVANDAGGLSVRVGGPSYPTAARGRVGSPADLRDWISGCAK